MTNFEYLIQSPEHIATEIYDTILGSDRCNCSAFSICNGDQNIKNCKQALIKWLNSEIDNDDP